MPFKTIIKLFQKLSSKCGNRLQSSTHESENPSRATPRTILEMLPAELIIYMAQFLPLSSTVLFTLSCRTACAILGTHYWSSLRAEDQYQQHFDFLSQLSKEYPPGYVPCYHCRVLHLCTLFLPSRPVYQLDFTPCRKAENLGDVREFLHPRFLFRTFQMAMKNFRLGLDYESWLECLCYSRTSIIQGFPFERTADARIVDSSLLLRVQLFILIPPGLNICNFYLSSIAICPHIWLIANGAGANLPETAGCAMNHQHGLQRCIRKSGIVSCIECPTEYELSLEECGQFGVAAICTKWMDLGEGKTILDPRWWSHLSSEYTASEGLEEVSSIDGRRLVDGDPVRSNHASIRGSFGHGPIVSLEIAERLDKRLRERKQFLLDMELRKRRLKIR